MDERGLASREGRGKVNSVVVEIYQEEASAAGETNSPKEKGGLITGAKALLSFFFPLGKASNGLLGYYREHENEYGSITRRCMRFGLVL